MVPIGHTNQSSIGQTMIALSYHSMLMLLTSRSLMRISLPSLQSQMTTLRRTLQSTRRMYVSYLVMTLWVLLSSTHVLLSLQRALTSFGALRRVLQTLRLQLTLRSRRLMRRLSSCSSTLCLVSTSMCRFGVMNTL